jgi:hypothetical protein
MTVSNWNKGKRIGVATFVAGSLDILAAIIMTLLYGREVSGMLRYVATGPFPNAPAGMAGALLGLATHFTLMAVMVAAFILAADHLPALKSRWIAAGVGYGLITYVVMNLIVVPLRFGAMPGVAAIATQLFCHLVLVGLPIAAIARRG